MVDSNTSPANNQEKDQGRNLRDQKRQVKISGDIPKPEKLDDDETPQSKPKGKNGQPQEPGSPDEPGNLANEAEGKKTGPQEQAGNMTAPKKSGAPSANQGQATNGNAQAETGNQQPADQTQAESKEPEQQGPDQDKNTTEQNQAETGNQQPADQTQTGGKEPEQQSSDQDKNTEKPEEQQQENQQARDFRVAQRQPTSAGPGAEPPEEAGPSDQTKLIQGQGGQEKQGEEDQSKDKKKGAEDKGKDKEQEEDPEKAMQRDLQRMQRAASQMKIREAAKAAKKVAQDVIIMIGQKVSAQFLSDAWALIINLETILGPIVGIIYINIHFLVKYFAHSKYVCRFGHEWKEYLNIAAEGAGGAAGAAGGAGGAAGGAGGAAGGGGGAAGGGGGTSGGSGESEKISDGNDSFDKKADRIMWMLFEIAEIAVFLILDAIILMLLIICLMILLSPVIVISLFLLLIAPQS